MQGIHGIACLIYKQRTLPKLDTIDSTTPRLIDRNLPHEEIK
jgi:hypothetical protein